MYELLNVLPKTGDYRRRVTANTKTEYIVLIAEQEQLTESIAIKLKEQGYRVEIFQNIISAATAIHQQEPNLIILDWTTCSSLDFNIYYYLRSTNNYIPVIALTKDTSPIGRVDVLNKGADYCLSKPFSIEEFLAIIHARLRQSKQKKSPILFFEDLQLNTITRQVYRNNRLINLTAKEFDLLRYFMLHPLQVLTRVQILETIWSFDFTGYSNIIEVYIRYLRIKLEAKQEKRLLQTVRSVGYVLRSN